MNDAETAKNRKLEEEEADSRLDDFEIFCMFTETLKQRIEEFLSKKIPRKPLLVVSQTVGYLWSAY